MNDAIKKMARAYADENFPQDRWTQNRREDAYKDFIAGASAHAKLLSEKGVEGARRGQIYSQFNGFAQVELGEFFDRSLKEGEAVEIIEALPALHKIEQLERQLAKCKEQRNGLHNHLNEYIYLDDLSLYDAELSELDGK